MNNTTNVLKYNTQRKHNDYSILGLYYSKTRLLIYGKGSYWQKIKEVIDNSPISVTDFASRINRSRDIAYKIFKRETIDTALLQKISKVLDYNFFKLYNNEQLQIVREEQTPYGKTTLLEDELKAYRKQITELEKKYELLEKLHQLTEEKLEGLKQKKKR